MLYICVYSQLAYHVFVCLVAFLWILESLTYLLNIFPFVRYPVLIPIYQHLPTISITLKKNIYAKGMCIGNQYQTNFINTHAKHTQLLSSFINVFHWGPTFHLMTFALILALQAFQKILITLIRCITLALKLN